MQHFFRSEVGKQFVDIIAVSLSGEELTGGDIEEGDADDMFVEMQAGHPVVLFLREGGVRIADTRCDEFGNTPLDQFLRQFGIFELVANGDTQSCPHEFGQVGIEGVERKARHLQSLHSTTAAVRTMCQRDIQDLRRLHGILCVSLIEVAATEEQHRVRILRFDVAKLLHHRSYFIFFRHIIVSLL